MEKKETKVKIITDNEVTTGIYYPLVSSDYHFSFEDDCFREFLSPRKCSFALPKVKKEIYISSKLITEILFKLDLSYVHLLYSQVKDANSYPHLDNIFYGLLTECDEISKKIHAERPVETRYTKYDVANQKIKESLLSNYEITCSTFMKTFLKRFYLFKLSSMSKELIVEYYIKKLNNEPIDEILTYMGISFDNNEVDNGIKQFSLKCIYDELDSLFVKLTPHLCWKCKNSYEDKCEKISAAFPKPDITSFKFIEQGYEMSGTETHYIVSKCANFERNKKQEVSNIGNSRVRSKGNN